MIKRIIKEVRRRPAYKWHRYTGILAAIFFVFLSITGIALNHISALKLDRQYLSSDWLLDWYGIEPKVDGVNFSLTDGRWLTGTATGLYLDARFVVTINSKPVGIAEISDALVIATKNEILLLTPDGTLIERGAGADLPKPIHKLGTTTDGFAIAGTAAGKFVSGHGLLEWKSSETTANWSKAAKAPISLLEKIGRAERKRMLSMERVLFDLHSGRLFGSWGPYFMDGIALLLLVLVGTGLYMSFSKRGQR